MRGSITWSICRCLRGSAIRANPPSLLPANYSGRVAVVDNGRVSVTLRAAVEDALAMANQGMPAAHIKSELERRAKLSSIYLAVDDLGYLVRGGKGSRLLPRRSLLC